MRSPDNMGPRPSSSGAGVLKSGYVVAGGEAVAQSSHKPDVDGVVFVRAFAKRLGYYHFQIAIRGRGVLCERPTDDRICAHLRRLSRILSI